MITLYGITRSRASRCLWMLEELGQPFKRELIAPRSDASRAPEYLALNPNARVPTLRDGEVTLYESMAINLYLAEKYSPELWPKDVGHHGLCFQWSLWAMTELDGLLIAVLRHRALLPEAERDEGEALKAQDALQRPLPVLNAALEGRPYLLGDAFSVADLNVASVMSWARPARIPMEPHPNVQAWLKRCYERPAYQRLLAEMRAAS